MEVQIKDLRERPGYYIKLVEAGAEVVITSNGVKRARLVPMVEQDAAISGKHFVNQPVKKGFLFGIWDDRDDVNDVSAYIHALREGRSF